MGRKAALGQAAWISRGCKSWAFISSWSGLKSDNPKTHVGLEAVTPQAPGPAGAAGGAALLCLPIEHPDGDILTRTLLQQEPSGEGERSSRVLLQHSILAVEKRLPPVARPSAGAVWVSVWLRRFERGPSLEARLHKWSFVLSCCSKQKVTNVRTGSHRGWEVAVASSCD